jgi:hypothetical protein
LSADADSADPCRTEQIQHRPHSLGGVQNLIAGWTAAASPSSTAKHRARTVATAARPCALVAASDQPASPMASASEPSLSRHKFRCATGSAMAPKAPPTASRGTITADLNPLAIWTSGRSISLRESRDKPPARPKRMRGTRTPPWGWRQPRARTASVEQKGRTSAERPRWSPFHQTGWYPAPRAATQRFAGA